MYKRERPGFSVDVRAIGSVVPRKLPSSSLGARPSEGLVNFASCSAQSANVGSGTQAEREQVK